MIGRRLFPAVVIIFGLTARHTRNHVAWGAGQDLTFIKLYRSRRDSPLHIICVGQCNKSPLPPTGKIVRRTTVE